MKVVKTISEVRESISAQKKMGKSIGLVPSMGFLHEGHGSLMDAARKESDFVVVSIFVNPTQFGENEDYSVYPRDLEKDTLFCEAHGVDLIFAPEVEEMYSNPKISVKVVEISEILCGKTRPIHFAGVCTVVSKLFNIVTPDYAYFGQKDAQQFYILQKMVKDLNFGVQLRRCPIVREKDGLAKSSRNVYLSPEERIHALSLSKAIFAAQEKVKVGMTIAPILAEMKEIIRSTPNTKIDYIEAVDLDTLKETTIIGKNTLFAMAVYVGKTRLIDNFILEEA
ncbi:pantoate--beta-alanine ligase [Fusobacterium necrophorum subsp. funduliforme ATCC 51357]|uniref:Pantothenate synthetase n=1 Tax=Fusobacterium necrophorum subsp. funduliforme TaxID=143387 RepID=A0A162J249_9FUSO|nr:pantoate--beta-alanine ligase [Fusobacterium necrophorum]AYV93841.1 pantoate--beta-alanine ligase [Fusobacterium necrophorum subsp. funduliforme]EIJ72434.1 pantoate--beta-alanine ligase [Fusobacterium necrophorum subsp. funduliforme ATCC 51357]KAB0552899.1 pantoate--beta-alanine ligase [Fusobacterium necrophorum subsp. funduliforme]KYL04906.1 pantoate--beta-alanine ligase [Fusobacterium necrophorum subsp. funduliforme]KYM45789.1 pantoate--beta-alanine ligase [Fusobacterium necrophorum subsp